MKRITIFDLKRMLRPSNFESIQRRVVHGTYQNKKTRKGSPILENLMQEMAPERSVIKTMINPEGEISISDAISKIIEPYRKMTTDYDSFYKPVMLACAAWNACVLPSQERDAMLQDMLAALPSDPQTRTDFLGTINAPMARKKKLFPMSPGWL
jgi:hypothetical protein